MYVDGVRVSKTVRYLNSIPTSYLNFFEGSNNTQTMWNAEYYFGSSSSLQ